MVSARFANDAVALGVHLGTVAIMAVYSTPFETNRVPAYGLAVMQGTAIVFHIFYVVCHIAGYGSDSFNDVQNQFKWFEYAVSATAGTVAVLSAEYVDYEVVIPLAAAAVLQQLLGTALDPQDGQDPARLRQPVWPRTVDGNVRAGDWWYSYYLPFVAACILQGTEFYYVIDRGGPTTLKLTYIIAWSSFGIHAWLRLQALRWSRGGAYQNARWVEAVYSCLGWVAKVAVFAVEWAHFAGMPNRTLPLFWLLHVFLLAALMSTVVTEG